MPRIYVTEAGAGLTHRFSGFQAPHPGEYEFPDDERFAGWLRGHADRGNVVIVRAPKPKPAAPPKPKAKAAAKPVRKAT